jgi:peptide/nickel transport system permease protein
MSENLSPNQKALKRLWRNRPALAGLFFIGFTILVALFGYVLAPDSSPNANNQSLSVALKNMGFEISVLKLRKNRELEQPHFFKKILRGAPSIYEEIPINNLEFQGDSVVVENYAGENPENNQRLTGSRATYHVVDVVYALGNSENTVVRKGENYVFANLSGALEEQPVEKVKQAAMGQSYTKKFWLGTDNFGRDILSRLILGVRISLIVGLIAVLISLSIGILLGAMAGYFGGRIDDFIQLVVNTIWSIPTILLVFAIVLAFGRGIGIIFLAVGLTMWVDVARLVRGQVLEMKQIQFVEAAQSMGFGTVRILLRHILPNILGPVMVVAASNFATAILVESGLSYLGFGIQPPTPSWGTMLNENYGYAIGGKPFLAMIPAFAIMSVVLAFNLVGNGFRDALDVKSRD